MTIVGAVAVEFEGDATAAVAYMVDKVRARH
jgi:hypothetical protein